MRESDDALRARLVAAEQRLGGALPPAVEPLRRRPVALSLAAAPVLILAFAVTALAGAVVLNQARGAPGVENPGQPLYGARLECMTPPDAGAYLTSHGFAAVVWQVERDAPAQPGSAKRGSVSVQQPTPPETGIVVPGSIIDGTLYMVVDQRSGAQRSGACGS